MFTPTRLWWAIGWILVVSGHFRLYFVYTSEKVDLVCSHRSLFTLLYNHLMPKFYDFLDQ